MNSSELSSWLYTVITHVRKVRKLSDALAIRRINAIAARIKVSVQQFERCFLIHRSKTELGPFIANTTCSELEWRYAKTTSWAQEAVATERCLRIGRGRE